MNSPRFRKIEIRLQSIRQLFDNRDPAPFRERDLNEDAAEYLVSSALELPGHSALEIVIHLGEAAAVSLPQVDIEEAVRSYFAYREKITQQEIRRTLDHARIAFVVGLLFLSICTAGSHFLRRLLPEGLLRSVTTEGTLIMGWVAMWKPLELTLYDWWPFLKTGKIYRRLSQAVVSVHYEGH